jgi:hypothetical protein
MSVSYISMSVLLDYLLDTEDVSPLKRHWTVAEIHVFTSLKILQQTLTNAEKLEKGCRSYYQIIRISEAKDSPKRQKGQHG